MLINIFSLGKCLTVYHVIICMLFLSAGPKPIRLTVYFGSYCFLFVCFLCFFFFNMYYDSKMFMIQGFRKNVGRSLSSAVLKRLTERGEVLTASPPFSFSDSLYGIKRHSDDKWQRAAQGTSISWEVPKCKGCLWSNQHFCLHKTLKTNQPTKYSVYFCFQVLNCQTQLLQYIAVFDT